MPTKTYSAADRPINVPLIGLRGDTLTSRVYKHFLPDGVTPRDLTGCTITCLGRLADGTAVDLTAYIVRDDPGGRYRVIVPPTVTNGTPPWPQGLGTYDLTLTDTLGIVTTYFGGALGLKERGHG